MQKQERHDNLAKQVNAMYNVHPFPNRERTPDKKSDERYEFIYHNFLHIPYDELRESIFFDAGCGTGENTWAWHRMLHPSNTVIGMDWSKGSVSIARHISTAPESPLFAVNSLLDLGMTDNSVDFLLCSGVLVAVTDPDRAFKELVRVLKPNGYMVLVLYHKYGRAVHGLRRAVIDLLEPNDIDRRAELGGKLFGASIQKVAEAEKSPLEGVLYDQFGLPCESRYSVTDALAWFEQGGIQYLGCWPPVEWSHFGKGFRFSKDFERLRNTAIGNLILKLFPDSDALSNRYPTIFDRLTMESLWGLKQEHLFAISGRKV